MSALDRHGPASQDVTNLYPWHILLHTYSFNTTRQQWQDMVMSPVSYYAAWWYCPHVKQVVSIRTQEWENMCHPHMLSHHPSPITSLASHNLQSTQLQHTDRLRDSLNWGSCIWWDFRQDTFTQKMHWLMPRPQVRWNTCSNQNFVIDWVSWKFRSVSTLGTNAWCTGNNVWYTGNKVWCTVTW